jgi:hypothetical protein
MLDAAYSKASSSFMWKLNEQIYGKTNPFPDAPGGG